MLRQGLIGLFFLVLLFGLNSADQKYQAVLVTGWAILAVSATIIIIGLFSFYVSLRQSRKAKSKEKERERELLQKFGRRDGQ
jgi:Kef-type K+ transport system membrane component KefB